jgi:hypothetical protein
MQAGARFEQKYILPRAGVDPVRLWLDHACATDPRHADNVIHSLYFDSRSLDAAEEKWQSTFFKTKVRLRWYTDAAGAPLDACAYLEVKTKQGRRTVKHRRSIDLDMSRFQADPVRAGAGLDLMELLPLMERDTSLRLYPVCVIRYHRRRYIDMRNGMRVALDSGIGVTHANPLFRFTASCAALRWAVLEVKGRGQARDPVLPTGIPALQVFRSAFSKYGECVKRLQGRSDT